MKAVPKKQVPRIVRMAHPLAFAAYLRHIGAPVDQYFRRQGLPALCEDPSFFVPLHKTWAFFHEVAKRENPLLGWHVGNFVGMRSLNTSLIKKLEQEVTLLRALQRLIQLISSEASHLQIGIREKGDDIIFFNQYPDLKGMDGYWSSQAYQFGVWASLIRHFAGKNWMPSEIGIEYPSVPTVAEEMFPGSRILPRQKFGYLAIPRTCLHLSARPRVSKGAEKESLVVTGELDFTEMLRMVLKPYLTEGYSDISLAASLMDTSTRTLSRKLAASGLTYRDLIDDLRFIEAKKLLKNTKEKIIDVAAAVGFDDPTHFARMFRRIGGLSPREFRRAQQSIP